MFQKNDTISNINDIIGYYGQFFSKNNPMRIGIEWERFGVFSDTKKPVGYLGERGFEKIIEGLHQKYNWNVEDRQQGHIFTLVRDKTRITTEGDGKPEISGAPFESLFDAQNELQRIAEEIETFAKPMNIDWFPMGLQPFHSVDEIPLAPKERYQTFLKLFSEHTEWMTLYMKAICGLHINIDTSSAEDLIKKTQALHRLSPILCGALANSPLENGKPSGLLSTRRARIFSGKGMGREILPGEKNILSKNFTLWQWVEEFMKRDMIILSRKGKLVPIPKGSTFLDFLKNGIANEKPTFQDVDTHIKTHWVDVRPRIGYLEFRSMDSLPLPETMAVTAFIKGITANDEAMDAVAELTKKWKEEDFANIHKEAWTHGIKADYKGISFVEVLKELMPLAEKNLQNLGIKNKKGEDESVLLNPMKKILESRKTPAEVFLEEKKCMQASHQLLSSDL